MPPTSFAAGAVTLYCAILVHYGIVTAGTRGDVQPFVALGKGLMAAGHEVTIATHPDFAEFVAARGLGFRPLGCSFKDALESPAGRAWVESGDSLTRYMKTFARFVRPMTTQFIAEVDEAIDGVEALVIHPFCLFATHAAAEKRIPFAISSLVPFVKSPEMAPLPFPRAPRWMWLRRFLQRVALESLVKPTADLYSADRAARGLGPLPKDPWSQLVADGVHFVHLYSELLVPRPTDWPSSASVTGFCFLDEQDEAAVTDELRAFIDDGDPPIYLGFGSMTGRDPEALARLAVEALEAVGERAIILTGWGGMKGAKLPDSILSVTSAPHGWLLPRVRAVVHHGGAGTTAAGLRAGRPTQVVSFFGDQPYWGHRVAAAGAGPRPLHRTRLTAASLTTSIRALIQSPDFAREAARIGEAMRREDGVAQAIEALGRAFR